jgi:hypothetical protein
VSTPDPPRSVRIDPDERTGWSSERPRRDGAAPRPPDLSVRSTILKPSDRLRYTPGSLVLILGPTASRPDQFADRVVEERGAVLSLAKVRALLAGRVTEDRMEAGANELLEAAVLRRIRANQSVVIPTESFDPAARERYVRLAHANRRPRHLILLEARRDDVLDDERAPLDELRRRLDAGELGSEGFQTVLRLSGNALTELKRIVFQPPPPRH